MYGLQYFNCQKDQLLKEVLKGGIRCWEFQRSLHCTCFIQGNHIPKTCLIQYDAKTIAFYDFSSWKAPQIIHGGWLYKRCAVSTFARVKTQNTIIAWNKWAIHRQFAITKKHLNTPDLDPIAKIV